jgi:hypothetical protein
MILLGHESPRSACQVQSSSLASWVLQSCVYGGSRYVASLTERFQTRFQPVRLQPPENEVLAAFIARRWGAPITITRQIAEGAKGNVRAALADLEMWMG